jgi:hypothetical protein
MHSRAATHHVGARRRRERDVYFDCSLFFNNCTACSSQLTTIRCASAAPPNATALRVRLGACELRSTRHLRHAHRHLRLDSSPLLLGLVLECIRLRLGDSSRLRCRLYRRLRHRMHRRSKVIIDHHLSSVVIIGHQWSSVVISGHQRSCSLIISGRPAKGGGGGGQDAGQPGSTALGGFRGECGRGFVTWISTRGMRTRMVGIVRS